MDTLEKGKVSYSLINRLPNAKKVGTGVYRVNPCPVCGGKDHFTLYEPMSGKNKNPWWTYSSYSGCCSGGSPIDYLIEVEGYSKEDAIKEIAGDYYYRSSPQKDFSDSIDPKGINKIKSKKEYDFTHIVDRLHDICNTSDGVEYYLSRGLNETIDKYKLGYSPNGYNDALREFPELNIKHNNAAAYKYFIPIIDVDGVYRYLIARHDNSINEKQKTWNMKGLDIRVFNDRYLKAPIQDNILFVCEGWADALSIEEAHYKGIALNSTQNANRFIDIVKNNIDILQNKTFVIALDNDIAGGKAITVIEEGLNSLRIATERFKLPKTYKDINEFLQADRGEFISYIKGYVNGLKDEDFTSSYITELIEQIKSNKNRPIISSGFREFDKKLGGGIYTGLYAIGAGSSIGKTTFALQVADNIASKGHDVLFFSLEMSKMEMVSKSLVREMFKLEPDNPFIPSTREFLNGTLEAKTLAEAYKGYYNTASHMAVIEGSFDTGVNDIRARIEKHILRRGTKPVVFVDYLQILKPIDMRMSDKQAIDYNIVELKRISREYDIPVILISSINRGNYLAPVSFESFKESGSIEYTCDVVIGLQLSVVEKFINDKEFTGEKNLGKRREEYNRAKAENPRSIELVILKNRNGSPTASHQYTYYPKFNLYEEDL